MPLSQRGLLIVGVAAIAASLLIGVAGTVGGVNGRSSGGMMGGLFGGGGQNIGMDRAITIAQGVAGSYSGGGLTVDELMEFTNNYYASVREKSTGIGAFEILIDKSSGNVMEEPPSMMWNTRYGMMPGGMMGGMMGGAAFGSSGPTTVTSDQARNIAQHWLDANQPGDSANSPDAFYGYYTVDFERGGELAGMLSVNGYSGQVWYHTWHGSFIQMKDLGALRRTERPPSSAHLLAPRMVEAPGDQPVPGAELVRELASLKNSLCSPRSKAPQYPAGNV
jgi:hypothetical protein